MEAASNIDLRVPKEERAMAKTKKRPAKKSSPKAKTKGSSKKVAKKSTATRSVKKPPATKAKSVPKKKPGGGSVQSTPAKPAVVKKAVPDEDTKKPTAAPAVLPKDPDLDDEELSEEEIEIGGESEIDEEMEEDLSLDDDEEDVDYLEKSDDLIDDADDYRH